MELSEGWMLLIAGLVLLVGYASHILGERIHVPRVTLLMHVSYLLACMLLGCVVANTAKHHTRAFHAIESVSDPFLAAFFVLAGFQLEVEALMQFGLLGIVYVVGRTIGLIWGGRLGAMIAKAPVLVQQRIG